MIFLANRANLDKRTLLTRIHNRLQSQVFNEASPVEHVWYHTSSWQYDQCGSVEIIGELQIQPIV